MAGILGIQINSLFNDKKKNLSKIEYYLDINSDRKLDLVLFPEFFSTNIAFEKSPEGENGGEVISKVCELAQKYNTNIVAGSVVRRVGTKHYNTSFAINRQGEVIAKYDKIHLYKFLGGNEHSFISEGNKIVTVDFDFARVGLAICFDIRYPLHFNKLIKEKVDIITLPTAWLIPSDVDKKPAKEMWLSMCRTRAYDNMTFFVVCNQTGKVGKDFIGIGNSMILSPTSQVLDIIDEQEGTVYSDIDVNEVKLMHSVYPISEID